MKIRVPSRGVIAFTMIEVLLAVGIFSMVMIAIYSSWSAILRGSRSGLMAAAEVQRARVTIRSLEESLGSCLLYADNLKYYAFFADTSSDFGYLSFVARLPQSFPGSGMFEGQDLRRVTFEVDPDGNLLLKQSPILEATDVIGDPYTIRLAPQVSTFAMEFFDARIGQWTPEWIYTNQLPRLMRVALGFGKDPATGNPQRLTMRTIPLNSVAITRIGAAAGGAGGPLPGGNPGGGGDQITPGGGGRGERMIDPGGGRGGDRFNQGGGGQGGGRGGGGFGGGGFQNPGGDFQNWRPPVRNDFGQNRGNVSRNPTFGNIPGNFGPGPGGGGGGRR